MGKEKTTVEVKEDTWRRLMLRKGVGDSFDDVISDILDTVEECEDELEDES